jgi:hypothetical protein
LSLDAEQCEILDHVDAYCKNLDVTWNKFKGDVVCRIVKRFIERHMSSGILKIVGPNVYLDGVPYEFDLLVVDANAKPTRELTSSFDPVSAHCIIEVKKAGIYSPKQPKTISQIFNRVSSKNSHIKCAYLTIEEVYTTHKPQSKNFYNICKDELYPHGFFTLRDIRKKQSIQGEWEKFLSYVL